MPATLPAHGEILLEGAFLARRAVSAGLRMLSLECVPAREEWARELLSGIPGGEDILRVVPEATLSDTAGYPFHRGVLARAARPAPASLESAISACIARESPTPAARPMALVLPELNDPENLGGCFRNAAALGCGCVIIGPDVPDPLSRRALRVSMGASLTLAWARLPSLAGGGFESCAEVFRRRGFRLAACVLDKEAEELSRYALRETAPLALVLGNEARGLGPEIIAACDDRTTLPMGGGTDSLNVATAAALFIYVLRGSST